MPLGVKRAWVLPGGQIKTELTPEEMQKFRQKVMDTLTPLFYEAVTRKNAEVAAAQEPKSVSG